MDGEWRPVRIDIKGPLDTTKTEQAKSMVQKQIAEDANFFCIFIDSPGGSPTDSVNLANFLADLDSSRRRTVAYISNEARADAAFIALACDHIVMTPEAILGGTGAKVIEGQEADLAAITLRNIAEKKFRSAALAEAIVNPNLQVFRYVRKKDGLKSYYTENEHAALPDSKDWEREAEVTTRGKQLQVNGEKAEQLGLTRHVVQDFAEFKAVYGLQGNMRLVEPSWADIVVDALNTPNLGFILLLLGAASLYAEFQSPGVGLGALVAALCFLLYFWSHFLGGTAGWLEVILFLVGMVCIALEVFVFPGFGIFGLGGGLMVLCSLVLASQTFVLPRNDYQIEQLRNTLLMLGGAAVGTMIAAALIHKFLPHTPMFNRMLLAPPSGEELSDISRREALAEWAHLLGRQGTTITPLAPSGKARFGEQLVDVIADGEFIERGQNVVVVETRGNRVLVKSLT
jgi:membrane-bound ClpP family serine protease